MVVKHFPEVALVVSFMMAISSPASGVNPTLIAVAFVASTFLVAVRYVLERFYSREKIVTEHEASINRMAAVESRLSELHNQIQALKLK
jgi:hypothetical protein